MKVSQLVVVKDCASYMDVNEGDVWAIRELPTALNKNYVALSRVLPKADFFNVSTGQGIVYADLNNIAPFSN